MGKHAHNVGLAASFWWAAGYRSGPNVRQGLPGGAGRGEEEGTMRKLRLWRGTRAQQPSRIAAFAGCLSLLGGVAVAGAATPALASAKSPAKTTAAAAKTGCQLGNGVKHVVELTFDNVHFFRDNPNVPSDLQMMPNLLNFFTSNGTFMSNNHTPL